MDIDDADTTPAGTTAAAPDDATAQQQKEKQEQQEREERELREQREAGKAPPPSEPIDPNDPDPIVASYNVYLNAPLPPKRKLMVLLHTNKQGPQREPYPTLSEVRIKPQHGFVEFDVPIDLNDPSYDREKGMRYGQALARSMASKGGGSHGLSGGFGVGLPAPRQGARRRDEDREVYDWAEAVRRDLVLRNLTIGGQIENGPANQHLLHYMVGAFKGGELPLLLPEFEPTTYTEREGGGDGEKENDRKTNARDQKTSTSHLAPPYFRSSRNSTTSTPCGSKNAALRGPAAAAAVRARAGDRRAARRGRRPRRSRCRSRAGRAAARS